MTTFLMHSIIFIIIIILLKNLLLIINITNYLSMRRMFSKNINPSKVDAYTKLYSLERSINLSIPIAKQSVKRWLTGLFSDPITNSLLKNSHLTKTQLETFLIDVLAGKTTRKFYTYEKKAKLRIITSGVSRGSFNRTLAQARKNVIKSIYTLILLGYLGLFETTNLEPYVEIANKIQTYTEAYREGLTSKKSSNEYLRIVSMLQTEIEKTLQQLSRPKEMSRR